MRVGVVGLGFMGATHAEAWTRVPGAQLKAVVSSDARKLSGDWTPTGGNLAREQKRLDLSNVTPYGSLDEILADPAVDAVDLCIPTDQHAAYAMESLRAGKHVLVEKPLALTAEDADHVVSEAERSGRVLMAGHLLRFMPAYTEARQRIAQLGSVRSAAFRRRCAAPNWSPWLRDASRSGGGAFDLLIHDFDYARWLFGMPEEIRASGTVDAERGIDLVTALLDYRGLTVTIAGGWHGLGGYPFSMDFTIVCEGGALEYCCGALIQYRTGMAAETICLANDDRFVAELSHFHECASHNRPSEICPVSESADAVRMIKSALASRL